MATSDNKHKRSMFNEATRVQMPALVHLTRLGYKYIGKMTEEMAGSVYDPDTNILINVFIAKFNIFSNHCFKFAHIVPPKILITIIIL